MRLLPRNVVPSRTLIDEAKTEVLAEQHKELEKLRHELSVL